MPVVAPGLIVPPVAGCDEVGAPDFESAVGEFVCAKALVLKSAMAVASPIIDFIIASFPWCCVGKQAG